MKAGAAAYRADGALVERDVFYALACDPARSVVVEACAGAGKTWMLVSRILRALVDGAAPHEILAITFTRKAAGEMRERLDDWLYEYATCGDEQRIAALVQRGLAPIEAAALAPRLAALHEELLAGGRPVEVRTFHAWFAQLLRAAPLELLGELGLQPDMELVEDLDDHRPEVFRRFHAALLADPVRRADYRALVAERGRHQVRRWLEAAWTRRVEFALADAAGVVETSVETAAEVWPELAGRDHPADVLHDAAWRAALATLAGALGKRTGKADRDAAAKLVDALAQADPQATFELAWGALHTVEDAPRKLDGAAAATQARLQVVFDQIRQHRAHVEQQRMARLARLLLDSYAGYKRERGLADMDDLERCGLALLRDATLAGWVQERLDARIRHVLIDEFQDTSPLQWQALHAWLSSYAGAGGGASGHRPPGVFIVGDPKQSIYRFRRAEPRVFAAARGFVADALAGVALACDHTRRNAPEVLAVVNDVFARAGAEGAFDGFRLHTTEVPPVPGAGLRALPRVLRPPRAVRAAAARTWRDTLTTPRYEAEEVLRAAEAAHVAQAVRELVEQQAVAPGEIFALCRKRESLRLAAEALRAVHLPFAAPEDHPLMEAAEARDLVALLDVLASPRHRLALAHALRSPIFGASDDDLVALAERAAGGDWWRELLRADTGRPALDRARALLADWHAAAQRLPPHDLLDRIVATGDVRVRVAASVPPEQRRAALHAVDAVLEQALTLDGARYATPYGFVRALKARLVKVAAPADAEAVQLLTVHGAKGLEARVVFVLDADPEPAQPDSATLLVDWPVDATAPRRCAFVYSESPARCPPSLRNLLAAELAARRREELNVLYVALTRAQERVVISATEPFRPDRSGPSWWQRLADLAVPWDPMAAAPIAQPVHATIELAVLPPWEGRGGAVAGDVETERTRAGKALHRVLEWATAPGAQATDLQALAAAAAREFGTPADAVARAAAAILANPACARFLSDPAIAWAGNEWPVVEAGEALRIDRLVALDDADGRTWWVLDYKLDEHPDERAAYRAQLLRYRDAVRAAQPGAAVRCAFITGRGVLIEIDV